jgi:hypothetical protein
LALLVLVTAAAASGRSASARLVRWDGQWYAGIAAHGYGFVRMDAGRELSDYAFFPLYPFLERIAGDLLRWTYPDAGLVVSAAASVFAAWGIFAVAEHAYDSATGLLTTCLWAALPMSAVEWMAYSESLFTALAAWSLYAVCTQRWWGAGALACLAGLTRPIGAAVIAAVVVPAMLATRRAFTSDANAPGGTWGRLAPLAGAAIAPLGWVSYVTWVGEQRGSPTGYFDVANGWGNGLDGGVAFARWTRRLLGSAPLSGVAVCLGIALLLTLLVYSTGLVVVALATSGFFGSKPRYLLPAFPLLLPVAQMLRRRRVAVSASVIAVLAAGSAVYGAIWLLGTGPP